ncbi:MAG: TetR family transcriptional regulator [Archangiaceae bacterium]|nr:TetR family transcriptional regulator [Archangiaceae bacterium]
MTKSESTDRVLDEAARLFRRQGYAATTVREIAKAADMLPGSLHYRFASKDDVLIALIDRGIDQAIDVVQREIAKVEDPIERLRVGIGKYLELLLEGDDALFVMLYDWRSLPPTAREGLDRARNRYEAFWDALLIDAYSTGKSRPVVDLALVRQFGFGAASWVATWYRKGEGRSPKQIADAFFAFLAYGLIDERHRPPDVNRQFETL